MTRKIYLKSFTIPKFYLKFSYFKIQILHGIEKTTRKIKMEYPPRFDPTTPTPPQENNKTSTTATPLACLEKD